MKRVSFVLMFFLIFTSFMSLDAQWAKTYEGPGYNRAYAVQQTTDGGYIVVGSTSSYDDNFWVLKLDSSGNIHSSCEFIKIPDVIVTHTSIIPEDTDIIPQDVDLTSVWSFRKYNERNVTITHLCPKCTLTISASSSGTTDPEPGNYTYDPGTEVTIKATPNSGYEFSNWSGDASGTSNPITITIDSDKFITANFSKKGPCFIATAAYGSLQHPHLDILRDFRDTYLMPNEVGSVLVDLYYKYSPFVAHLIARHKALKIVVQINLLPLIAFSYSMVHFGPIITTIILGFIYILPIFLVSFCRRKRVRVETKDLKHWLPKH